MPEPIRLYGRTWFVCGNTPYYRNWKGPLHREIYSREIGPIPRGRHVHHKDGNPLNNAADNLELVTRKEHSHKHRKRVTFHCKWCGKKSTRWTKNNGDDPEYCSHLCSQAVIRRKNGIGTFKRVIPCQHCGEKFETALKRSKFCSYECKFKETNRRNAKPLRSVTCGTCGAVFESRWKTAKFCSTQCNLKAQRKKRH